MKFVVLLTLAMMAISCAHHRANSTAQAEGPEETQLARRWGAEPFGAIAR
jgi:hypothetical protein